MASAINAQLADENLDDSPVAVLMAAHDEQETNDTTSLSSTLAIPSAGGTVTVYATSDETFTTVDTSTGTAASVPGEQITNYLFTYSTSGGTPQLTGYVDADAALTRVGPDETPTASSPALDGPPPTGGPSPVSTDSSGNFTSGSDSTSAPCIDAPNGGRHGGYRCPHRPDEVTWALNHAFHSNPHNFADDCTDFASRVLNTGGNLFQVVPRLYPGAQQSNDHYWYYKFAYDHELHAWRWFHSHSWTVAQDQAQFFVNQGSYYLKYASNSKPGYLIFAEWNGNRWGSIDHVGVITVVNGTGIYITQHTNDRKNESLYRQKGRRSWYGSNPHMTIWIVIPSRKI